jgi:hypothetical protein
LHQQWIVHPCRGRAITTAHDKKLTHLPLLRHHLARYAAPCGDKIRRQPHWLKPTIFVTSGTGQLFRDKSMSNSIRSLALAATVLAGFAPLVIGHADAKTMAECSVMYKAAKAKDDTLVWKDFRKAQCGADSASTAAAPADTPVAKPAKAKKQPAATATAPADAGGQTFAQKCSAGWAALKAANQVPAGMTWNDFRKAKCVVDGAAAAQPASTKAKATKPAATTAAAPADTTGGQTFIQKCSTDWAALKAANQVPDGMTWNDFRKAKCVVDAAALPQAADENATPVEPTQAVNLDNIDVATVSKSGKPFTPGQIAAHKRQKACGMKWREEKTANTLPVGMKWPQYWSQCNTKMKAALTN